MNKKSKINKVMLSISTMALSLGAIQTHASAEEKVPYNVLHSKPVGIEKPVDEIGHVSKAEETLSFEERLKSRRLFTATSIYYEQSDSKAS